MTLHVLGVGSSMRAGSRSTRVLSLALETMRKHGAEVRLLDLRTVDLPIFRPEQPAPSRTVQEASELVRWADAFLLATPDYHGGMSGALKNFLDYHWKELAGKLFGVICASHEKGLTAMDQVRTVVRQCYGWSLPYGVTVHGDDDIALDGTVTNPRLRDRLEILARDLVVYGGLLRQQFRQDQEDREPHSFSAHYGA